MSGFEKLFADLNAHGVRYVVVVGVATVLHGYARLTADLDVIIDLERAAAENAMRAFTELGMRPRAPVDALDFADPDKRRAWIADKGMRVFSLHDPSDPFREVDVFVEELIPFSEVWQRAETMDLGSTTVRVASIRDLITLKRIAGRPQDLEDIEALEAIERAKNDD